jgi:superfamily I DNA/RNA helicase
MAWNDNINSESPAYKLITSNAPIIRSIAGPGSGKSFAIKKRIMRLLEEGVEPTKILAITFTRTAAADLKKEISSIGIKGCEKVEAKTLHSHAMLILLRSDVKTIKRRQPRIALEHEIDPALRDIEYPTDSSIDDRRKLLKLYEAAWANLQIEEPGLPRDKTEEEFQDKIVDWLIYHQGMMIGEVIPIALNYLQNNPASPEIGKYSAILIDEYQDLNKAEQVFISLLRGTADVVIVGDDDQSIYGFKYAYPEGIRQISNLYGEYSDINFDIIRRCPKRVTRMASALISKNPNRTLAELIPFEKNQEGQIEILQWNNYEDEINGIVYIVEQEIEQNNISPGDILILVPRRLIGYKIENKLIVQGVPAKSYFREDIIKNDAVRRAYSLIQLLANPTDKISLRFLLGFGSNNFRMNQYKILKNYSDDNSKTIKTVLDEILKEKVSIKGISNIIKEYRKILMDLIQIKKKLADDPLHVFELFSQDDDDEDFYEINSIFQEIMNKKPFIIDNYDDFDAWLKDIVNDLTYSIAMPDTPETTDNVRIMSLHASKGLNAKFVIMVSMIDDLMPFIPKNTIDVQKTIEEQRRLFYVAMTRCRSSEHDYQGRLIISSFIWIYGIDAVKMGIPITNPKNNKKVSASRFIADFGRTAPKTILGSTLIT